MDEGISGEGKWSEGSEACRIQQTQELRLKERLQSGFEWSGSHCLSAKLILILQDPVQRMKSRASYM